MPGENGNWKVGGVGRHRESEIEPWEWWIANLRLISLWSLSPNLGRNLGGDESILILGIIEGLTVL